MERGRRIYGSETMNKILEKEKARHRQPSWGFANDGRNKTGENFRSFNKIN